DEQIARVPDLLAQEKQLEYAVQRYSNLRRTLESTRDSLLTRALQQKQTALIIDRASPPTRPVYPIMWLNMLVAGLCGLVAGVLYALLLEHIESYKRLRTMRVIQVQEWARYLTADLPGAGQLPVHSGG